MLNAYWEPLTFDLPSVAPEGPWRRCIYTSLPSGDARESAPFVDDGHYVVQPRSVVFLLQAISDRDAGAGKA